MDMIVLHYNKHVSDLKQSLSLPHTQQGFNWSWIAGSLRGLKVAGSLMINEVRLCECVSKCVRMFALRRGVKWLRKTTGSSGTAKSLPVTNHRLSNMFKCHRAITRNEVSAVSCLHLPANVIISADRCCVSCFVLSLSCVRCCVMHFFNQMLFMKKFAQTWFQYPLFSQFHKINTFTKCTLAKCYMHITKVL